FSREGKPSVCWRTAWESRTVGGPQTSATSRSVPTQHHPVQTFFNHPAIPHSEFRTPHLSSATQSIVFEGCERCTVLDTILSGDLCQIRARTSLFSLII